MGAEIDLLKFDFIVTIIWTDLSREKIINKMLIEKASQAPSRYFCFGTAYKSKEVSRGFASFYKNGKDVIKRSLTCYSSKTIWIYKYARDGGLRLLSTKTAESEIIYMDSLHKGLTSQLETIQIVLNEKAEIEFYESRKNGLNFKARLPLHINLRKSYETSGMKLVQNKEIDSIMVSDGFHEFIFVKYQATKSNFKIAKVYPFYFPFKLYDFFFVDRETVGILTGNFYYKNEIKFFTIDEANSDFIYSGEFKGIDFCSEEIKENVVSFLVDYNRLLILRETNLVVYDLKRNEELGKLEIGRVKNGRLFRDTNFLNKYFLWLEFHPDLEKIGVSRNITSHFYYLNLPKEIKGHLLEGQIELGLISVLEGHCSVDQIEPYQFFVSNADDASYLFKISFSQDVEMQRSLPKNNSLIEEGSRVESQFINIDHNDPPISTQDKISIVKEFQIDTIGKIKSIVHCKEKIVVQMYHKNNLNLLKNGVEHKKVASIKHPIFAKTRRVIFFEAGEKLTFALLTTSQALFFQSDTLTGGQPAFKFRLTRERILDLFDLGNQACLIVTKNSVEVVNFQTGQTELEMAVDMEVIKAEYFSSKLLLLNSANQLRLFSYEFNSMIKSSAANQQNQISRIRFSPTGHIVVSYFSQSKVDVFDLNLTLIGQIECSQHAINDIFVFLSEATQIHNQSDLNHVMKPTIPFGSDTMSSQEVFVFIGFKDGSFEIINPNTRISKVIHLDNYPVSFGRLVIDGKPMILIDSGKRNFVIYDSKIEAVRYLNINVAKEINGFNELPNHFFITTNEALKIYKIESVERQSDDLFAKRLVEFTEQIVQVQLFDEKVYILKHNQSNMTASISVMTHLTGKVSHEIYLGSFTPICFVVFEHKNETYFTVSIEKEGKNFLLGTKDAMVFSESNFAFFEKESRADHLVFDHIKKFLIYTLDYSSLEIDCIVSKNLRRLRGGSEFDIDIKKVTSRKNLSNQISQIRIFEDNILILSNLRVVDIFKYNFKAGKYFLRAKLVTKVPIITINFLKTGMLFYATFFDKTICFYDIKDSQYVEDYFFVSKIGKHRFSERIVGSDEENNYFISSSGSLYKIYEVSSEQYALLSYLKNLPKQVKQEMPLVKKSKPRGISTMDIDDLKALSFTALDAAIEKGLQTGEIKDSKTAIFCQKLLFNFDRLV